MIRSNSGLWAARSLRRSLAVLLLVGIAPAASAEWFAGAAVGAIETKLSYENGSDVFKPISGRVFGGYRKGLLGGELDLYLPADYTRTSFTGTDDKFSIKGGVGAFVHVNHKWVTARVGGIWMDSELEVEGFGTAGDSVFMPAASLGLEFGLGESFAVTADYEVADGSLSYAPIVSGSGRTDIGFRGFRFGLQFMF